MQQCVVHLNAFVPAGQLPVWINTAVTPNGQNYADLTEKWHAHDFVELVVVKRGTAIHKLRSGVEAVQGGDVLVIRGEHEHCFERRRGLVLLNVMFDPSRLPLPLERLRMLAGWRALFEDAPPGGSGHIRLHLDAQALAGTVADLEAASRAQRGQMPGADIQRLGILLKLMAEMSMRYERSGGPDPQALLRLSGVIGEMESNPSFDWTIDVLAARSGLSRNHFMRIFQRATGHSAIAHLLNLRIREAQRRLRESTESITDIAYRIGFSDSNYFTRQFRRIVGCSPSEWRKSATV